MTAFTRFYYNYCSWYLIISWIILTMVYLFYGLSNTNTIHYDIINHKFITMNIYQSFVIYILNFGIYSHLGFFIYYYLII
jgi:hypothetical protein